MHELAPPESVWALAECRAVGLSLRFMYRLRQSRRHRCGIDLRVNRELGDARGLAPAIDAAAVDPDPAEQ